MSGKSRIQPGKYFHICFFDNVTLLVHTIRGFSEFRVVVLLSGGADRSDAFLGPTVLTDRFP